MFCEIYLQSAAHITTGPPFIYSFLFQVHFQVLKRSSIPNSSILDPQSSILDPRSSILDPGFPENLEVLLIKIILFFSTTEVISCSKIINAFKP